jgi:DNA repair ATPase RecN
MGDRPTHQDERVSGAAILAADRKVKKFITGKELGSLGMKRTTFDVQIDRVPLSPKGVDRVEFLISPNVGEAVKPLAKIASGGSAASR